MSTKEKANLKLDKNNDEAVAELSPNEADAVAGGNMTFGMTPPASDDAPMGGGPIYQSPGPMAPRSMG